MIADPAAAVGVAAALPAALRRAAGPLAAGLALGATRVAACRELAGAGVVVAAGLAGAAGATGSRHTAPEVRSAALRGDVRAGLRSAASALMTDLAVVTADIAAGLVQAPADVVHRAVLSPSAASAVDESAAIICSHSALGAELQAGAGDATRVVQTDRTAGAARPPTLLVDAGAGAVDAGLVLPAITDAGTAAAVRIAAVLPRTVRQAAGAVDTLDLRDRAGAVTEAATAVRGSAGRARAVGEAACAGLADLSCVTTTGRAGLELAEALTIDAGFEGGAQATEGDEATLGVQVPALPCQVSAGERIAHGADPVETVLTPATTGTLAVEIDALAAAVHAGLPVAGARAEGTAPPAAIRRTAGLPGAVRLAADAVDAVNTAGTWPVADATTAILCTAGLAITVRSTAGPQIADLAGRRAGRVRAGPTAAVVVAAELAGTIGDTPRPALALVAHRVLRAALAATLEVVTRADEVRLAGLIRPTGATRHGPATAIVQDSALPADDLAGEGDAGDTDPLLAGRDRRTAVPCTDQPRTGALAGTAAERIRVRARAQAGASAAVVGAAGSLITVRRTAHAVEADLARQVAGPRAEPPAAVIVSAGDAITDGRAAYAGEACVSVVAAGLAAGDERAATLACDALLQRGTEAALQIETAAGVDDAASDPGGGAGRGFT